MSILLLFASSTFAYTPEKKQQKCYYKDSGDYESSYFHRQEPFFNLSSFRGVYVYSKGHRFSRVVISRNEVPKESISKNVKVGIFLLIRDSYYTNRDISNRVALGRYGESRRLNRQSNVGQWTCYVRALFSRSAIANQIRAYDTWYIFNNPVDEGQVIFPRQ